MSCPYHNILECDFIIENNTFRENIAAVQGGAIYYDLYPPVGLLANTYLSNKAAKYGPNYGSFPFKLRLLADSDIIEHVSGYKLETDLLIGLYD